MSIVINTISGWAPFEASLLEWRRLCKHMKFLDSSREVDVERESTHLGQVLWGIELTGSSYASRMLGVCWEWREVIPNVVALSNPMEIRSNVLLKDERGEIVTPSKLVLHLNAAVNGFRWQPDLILHAGIQRGIAA